MSEGQLNEVETILWARDTEIDQLRFECERLRARCKELKESHDLWYEDAMMWRRARDAACGISGETAP